MPVRITHTRVKQVSAVLDGSPVAMKSVQIAKALNMSLDATRRILVHMHEENLIQRADQRGKFGHVLALYYPMGREFRSGEIGTMAFPSHTSARCDEPRRVMGPAKQMGMCRHWQDEAFFGPAPTVQAEQRAAA